MKTDDVHLYIVSVSVPASVFRERLAAIPGARVVRELPPRRVVVALRSGDDRARLATVPGVETLVEDRREHHDHPA